MIIWIQPFDKTFVFNRCVWNKPVRNVRGRRGRSVGRRARVHAAAARARPPRRRRRSAAQPRLLRRWDLTLYYLPTDEQVVWPPLDWKGTHSQKTWKKQIKLWPKQASSLVGLNNFMCHFTLHSCLPLLFQNIIC